MKRKYVRSFYTLFINRDDADFITLIHETNLTHQEIRCSITDELSNYPAMYDLLKNQRRISPRTWMKTMRKDKEYADDIFIQLTANWLKREIVILPWNKDDGKMDIFNPITIRPVDSKGRPVDAEGVYYILYYPESWFAAGSHYQSIMPIDNSDLSNQTR